MEYTLNQSPVIHAEEYREIMPPGSRFYIDYPKKVAGKMIFDGKHFLGERHHFIVRCLVDMKIKGRWTQEEDVYCIFIKKIKIRPTGTKNGKPFYAMWGHKQRKLPAQGTSHG